MITFLADHDIEGHVVRLWQTFEAMGWLALTGFQITTLQAEGLPVDSLDRVVWNWAQTHGLLIVTGNRNKDGPDSLEQTIRDQNHPLALPVLTVASVARLAKAPYREQCATRLAEIGLYLDNYRGVGRLFIP